MKYFFSFEGSRGIEIVKKNVVLFVKNEIQVCNIYQVLLDLHLRVAIPIIRVGCSLILEQVLRFIPHTAHTVSPGQLLHLAAKGAALLEFISIKSDLKHNKFLNYAQTARA
jgi:hypothetical protein